MRKTILSIGLVLAAGCAPTVHGRKPTEIAPHGSAPGAQSRLLATHPDGTKEYVLVLAPGDEVASALVAFARAEKVVSARFQAIGGVEQAELAWYDVSKKQFKTLTREEPMEVLSLLGDIAVGVDGQPVAHAHMSVGRSCGQAWGGHLVHALVKPTLEVFVTTYPAPLKKRADEALGIQVIDVGAP